MNCLKCVLVGAPQSGKTSLINRFMSGTFENRASNALTTYNVNMIYKIDSIKNDLKQFGYKANLLEKEENKIFNFKIYEYSAEYLTNNELNNVDVVILCYRPNSEQSKDILFRKELAIVNSKWPNVPRVLVSCCCDLEFEIDESFVKNVNPKRHYLCSSKTDSMVTEMFIESFKIAALNYLAKKDRLINEFDDWVVCESKNLLDKELFGLNPIKISEKITNGKTWVSAGRFIISFLAFSCLCMYFISIQYCSRNKSHCDEILVLSKEAFDESISVLNESYLGFVNQIKKF